MRSATKGKPRYQFHRGSAVDELRVASGYPVQHGDKALQGSSSHVQINKVCAVDERRDGKFRNGLLVGMAHNVKGMVVVVVPCQAIKESNSSRVLRRV